jgi:23S rRNA (uracil1939-C5)-methyltransferase
LALEHKLFTAQRVEDLAAGGAGVLHYRGLCVFVDMTAPGDIITGRITELHKTFARAELVELLQASPDRVAPLCPHYGLCGGCSQQHIAYKAQIAAKARILQETLRRIGGLHQLPAITIREGAPWEYRNRVQFHKADSGVGYKARADKRIIPIDDCPVAYPAIRQALNEKRLAITAPRAAFYARGETFLSEEHKASGTVKIRNRTLHLDAGVFFQSNGDLLEVLIGDILGIVEKAAPQKMAAADLYCGVGTFAVFLHDRLKDLDLVEENVQAVSLARKNLKGSGVSFYTGSASTWRPTKNYGFILVDPPRAGLSPIVRNRLLLKRPSLLLYVSCDPATLARDIRDITRAGYALSALFLYDFYPQTPHIETMAVLSASRDTPASF